MGELEVAMSIATGVFQFAEQNEIYSGAAQVKVASRCCAISAIVAFSAEHNDTLAFEPSDPFFDRVDDSDGCILHQLETRNAIPLGGQPIDFAHLCRR